MKLSAKPLGSQVFIKPDEKEKQTASGIIIPDAAGEKPDTGTVMAVGPGTTDVPVTVKEGERVLFRKNVGIPIKIDGVDLVAMAEKEHGRDNILAIIQ